MKRIYFGLIFLALIASPQTYSMWNSDAYGSRPATSNPATSDPGIQDILAGLTRMKEESAKVRREVERNDQAVQNIMNSDAWQRGERTLRETQELQQSLGLLSSQVLENARQQANNLHAQQLLQQELEKTRLQATTQAEQRRHDAETQQRNIQADAERQARELEIRNETERRRVMHEQEQNERNRQNERAIEGQRAQNDLATAQEANRLATERDDRNRQLDAQQAAQQRREQERHQEALQQAERQHTAEQRQRQEAHEAEVARLQQESAENEARIRTEAAEVEARIKRESEAILFQMEKDREEVKLRNEITLKTHELETAAAIQLDLEQNHADILAQQEERRTEHEKALQKQKWELINQLFENKKAMAVVATGGSTVIAVSLAAYFGFPILWRNVERVLIKPKLVSKTSRFTLSGASIKALFVKKKINKRRPKVILAPALRERMRVLGEYIINTSKHQGVFQHILLKGEPGTGKTMWAELLAELAGLDYAIISSAALRQFSQAEAIQELKQLFAWSRSNSKKTILFFDEFDAIGQDRDMLDEKMIPALNEFLAQTGTETKDFVIIFATNRPEVLDLAVLTRIGESVQFTLPTEKELVQIMQQYIHYFIVTDPGLKKARIKINVDALTKPGMLEDIATRFYAEKMSGRDTMYFVNGLKAMALGQSQPVITPELLETAVQYRIEKKHEENEYQARKAERRKLAVAPGA